MIVRHILFFRCPLLYKKAYVLLCLDGVCGCLDGVWMVSEAVWECINTKYIDNKLYLAMILRYCLFFQFPLMIKTPIPGGVRMVSGGVWTVSGWCLRVSGICLGGIYVQLVEHMWIRVIIYSYCFFSQCPYKGKNTVFSTQCWHGAMVWDCLGVSW